MKNLKIKLGEWLLKGTGYHVFFNKDMGLATPVRYGDINILSIKRMFPISKLIKMRNVHNPCDFVLKELSHDMLREIENNDLCTVKMRYNSYLDAMEVSTAIYFYDGVKLTGAEKADIDEVLSIIQRRKDENKKSNL